MRCLLRTPESHVWSVSFRLEGLPGLLSNLLLEAGSTLNSDPFNQVLKTSKSTDPTTSLSSLFWTIIVTVENLSLYALLGPALKAHALVVNGMMQTMFQTVRRYMIICYIKYEAPWHEGEEGPLHRQDVCSMLGEELSDTTQKRDSQHLKGLRVKIYLLPVVSFILPY